MEKGVCVGGVIHTNQGSLSCAQVPLRRGQLQDPARACGTGLTATALPEPLPALRHLHLHLRGAPLHGGAGGRGEGGGQAYPAASPQGG